MMYFANKGLFIREIYDDLYVIQDALGTCSMPFKANKRNLDEKTIAIANVHKLVTTEISSEFPNYSDFKWDELEKYYCCHLDNSFLACLVNKDELKRYWSTLNYIPIAYLECGYGDGSKSVLEHIHTNIQKLCKNDDFLIRKSDLELFLVNNQVKRICKDIMSLISRSLAAYTELLINHRRCIYKSFQAIEQLNSKEIIHRGQDTYKAASDVTSLVISLCSSLDLSAKLVQYINSINTSDISFKTAKDKQYHEVKKISPNFLPKEVLDNILSFQRLNNNFSEIIQLRNDLIHSTSAIELEKIYVGSETSEINNMPLLYSAQYARDCLDSGQPIRFLGRDYFVEEKVDIDVKTLSWIHKIFGYHISVAKEIHCYLKTQRKPN